MTSELPTELQDALTAFAAATARVEGAAAYLTGRFFLARIQEGIAEGMARMDSPYVNRRAAAARWYCTEAEIDRAARAGILTAQMLGSKPLFLKAQGDAAIREGRWNCKHKHTKSDSPSDRSDGRLVAA